MRLNYRLLRVVSLGILVLLIGITFLTPIVRAAGLWYVSKSGDDTHDCLSPATACATINGALAKITPGDTIQVDNGVYTGESQFVPVIEITKEVILSGGWNSSFTTQDSYTIIDGQGVANGGILSSGGSYPVLIHHFIVQNSLKGIENYSTILTLDDCIIQNNHFSSGFSGGLYSSYSPTVTILNSIIRNNSSSDAGGISMYGENAVLIIRNSSITGNAGWNFAGGVNLNGGLGETGYIENTTISGNSSEYSAGAVLGPFEIFNSTITGNSSPQNIGGISGAITLYNTILAGNSAPSHPNCYDGIASGGYNLFNITNGCLITSQPSDLLIADPGLGPLQGAPAYHSLLPNSPAVNAGNPAGCLDHTGALLNADQRGKPRVGRCDIGAFELEPLEYSTFQVDHENAHLHQLLTFTALLRTAGSETLTGVTMTNTIPGGLIFLPYSLQASSGSALYSGNTVTWSGDIAPNAPVTLTYWAIAAVVSEGENSMVITSSAETVLRGVHISIIPWTAYIPVVTKPCPTFFADYFTNPNSGWYTANNTNYSAQYLPGEYQILMKVPDDVLMSRAPSASLPNNFKVSVDVRNVTGVMGSGGLIFGVAGDWSYFYTFEIHPDQTFYLWRWNGSSWEYITSNFASDIRAGGQINTLTVRHNSDLFVLSINNQWYVTFHDPNDFSGSYVGVISTSMDATPLDMRFTNFIIPETYCAFSTLLPAASPSSAAPGGFFAGPASRPAPQNSMPSTMSP